MVTMYVHNSTNCSVSGRYITIGYSTQGITYNYREKGGRGRGGGEGKRRGRGEKGEERGGRGRGGGEEGREGREGERREEGKGGWGERQKRGDAVKGNVVYNGLTKPVDNLVQVGGTVDEIFQVSVTIKEYS